MSSTKTPAAGPHRRAACESVAEMHSMAQYKTKKPPMPCGLCLSPGHRVYGPYVGVNGVNAGHFYAIVPTCRNKVFLTDAPTSAEMQQIQDALLRDEEAAVDITAEKDRRKAAKEAALANEQERKRMVAEKWRVNKIASEEKRARKEVAERKKEEEGQARKRRLADKAKRKAEVRKEQVEDAKKRDAEAAEDSRKRKERKTGILKVVVRSLAALADLDVEAPPAPVPSLAPKPPIPAERSSSWTPHHPSSIVAQSANLKRTFQEMAAQSSASQAISPASSSAGGESEEAPPTKRQVIDLTLDPDSDTLPVSKPTRPYRKKASNFDWKGKGRARSPASDGDVVIVEDEI